MAFTTPRTWDGTETANVATYLEALRTNNIDLAGRLPVVNIGFYGAELQNSSTSPTPVAFHMSGRPYPLKSSYPRVR